MKFIAFTQTADYQLAMAKTGQMSVVKSLDSQEARTVPAVRPVHQAAADAHGRGRPCRRPRRSTPRSQNELTKAFQGSESVQQALDNAASQIDPLLTAKK